MPGPASRCLLGHGWQRHCIRVWQYGMARHCPCHISSGLHADQAADDPAASMHMPGVSYEDVQSLVCPSGTAYLCVLPIAGGRPGKKAVNAWTWPPVRSQLPAVSAQSTCKMRQSVHWLPPADLCQQGALKARAPAFCMFAALMLT